LIIQDALGIIKDLNKGGWNRVYTNKTCRRGLKISIAF